MALCLTAVGLACGAQAGDYHAKLTPQLRQFVQGLIPDLFTADGRDKNEIKVVTANTGAHAANETLVYIIGPGECGSSGCRLLILAQAGRLYKILDEATVVERPIALLRTWTHGRPDLLVSIKESADVPYADVKLRFDGSKYPSNPTVAPAIPTRGEALGQVLISEDDQGERLYP